MKISIICTEFPPNYRGGLGIYMERVVKQLVEDKHDLTLYTLNYPYPLPKTERRDSLTIHRISPCRFTRKGLDATRGELSLKAILFNALNLAMFNWHTFRKLWRSKKRNELGTLAVHDWMCVPAALLLYYITRQPLVFHVHSTEMSMNLHGTNGFTPKVAAWLERKIGKVARHVIVPSEEIKQQLESFGWDATKISVVHHGYEDTVLQGVLERAATDTETQRLLKRDLGLGPATKVLLFAGRLITHKGVDTLLRAMPLVIKKHSDVKLVLVGSGEANYQQLMQSTIHTLGIEAHVHAYFEQMPQEAVMQHYCLADVCIFPSVYEPFGFVALEAMSLAKPVVLGCGFPEVIRAPQNCGYTDAPVSAFSDSDNAMALAECINRLLEAPEEAKQLGERAQAYVKQQFRWHKTSTQTLQVYEQIG